MHRLITAALTLLALIAVPACSLMSAAGGEDPAPGGPLATPTPTPVLGGGGGDGLPPGEHNLELELTYLLVTTAGTDQPVTFATTIPIRPGLSLANPTGSGEGEILDDVPFTIGPVTTHNVADWIIEVTASLDPAGGGEPLALDFIFTGQGYASVQEVQVGAHMDTGGDSYEYRLSLPMEEGASESFDIEGWTDIEEWTVVLHLK